MSMFGIGRPQPSSAEKIAAAEHEVVRRHRHVQQALACMHEEVAGCSIDWYAAKFFDVQMKVSEILQAEAQAKGAGGGQGPGGMGFGGM
ncbi:hypothetical protein VE04_07271 [Pseudogymnoascus sp. 24MN13]|nr:hypothetical protein VE04_07271 [Pseudogymnoascus sp. 24MN13]